MTTSHARLLLDSLAPSGSRLTTFEVCLPKPLVAQLNTHRQLSRNTRSSRAVPIARLIEEVECDPYVPVFHAAGRGMAVGPPLADQESSRAEWLAGRDEAVARARNLAYLGAAKEDANRLLEPWAWAWSVVSGTNWENFLALRVDSAAQLPIRRVAHDIWAALRDHEPTHLRDGQWHLPYLVPEDFALPCEQRRLLSAARCARVSFAPFDGNSSHAAEFVRAFGLRDEGHWSPFEHQARAASLAHLRSGNFVGWTQHRKLYPNECRTFDVQARAC